jgi:clan AA aspartic protease (TIGR02281 family)
VTIRAALLGSLLLLVSFTSAGGGAAVSDLNDAGTAAYSRGDYVAAERLFDQAVAQAPRDPLLHYHRGVTLMRLSRWHEASAAFETVLRLNPPADLAATAQQGIRSLAPLLRAPAPRNARSEETLVPLRRAGGSWIADVRLNGSRTAHFVVDTGASACVISPELAGDLGIRPGPGAEMIPMQVVGGVTVGPRITLASVRVGDAEVENVAAVIHSIGPGIEGLLGNSFLGRFTVTVDPGRGVLILRPR